MMRFSLRCASASAALLLFVASRCAAGDDPSLRGGQLLPGAKASYDLPKEPAAEKRKAVTFAGNKHPRIDGQYYEAIDKTYRILVPWLSTGRIKVADEAVSPGITNLVRFTDSDGSVAVVISTKVRADWPKNKDILDHCIQKSLAVLNDWPAEQSCLQRVTGPHGKANQWIIKNVDDPPPGFFPLLVSVKGKPDKLESIGISRLLVVEGYLYEFAMVPPVGKNGTIEKAVVLAQEQMDQLMSGWELSSKERDRK
jgi:hypothetical protein